MPSVITNLAKETMISSISGSDLKLALLNNIVLSAENTLKNYGSWNDLSAFEINGINYTAGGISLSGLSVYSVSSEGKAYFNGNSIIWNNVNLSAYGYTIYKSTSNLVIAIVQFNGDLPKVSENGTFSISWSENKILQMIG